jgi:HAD superfamily hydrolase (TIGR01459 family)
MVDRIPVLPGISTLVGGYDAFVLDLWGVIHDGVKLYPGVADTLARLKALGKPYVMLTNAPRRAPAIRAAMEEMGLARELAPHVISSGEATWLALGDAHDPWLAGLERKCLHIGPRRDSGLFEGLDLVKVPVEEAAFIVNTGPWRDGERVEDYEATLRAGAARGLKMICANPDLEVIRGGRRIICAGALAQRYEALGGTVRYYGKPHRPIYDTCFAILGASDPRRVLAIGDSLHTDIAGAVGYGMDSVLVIGGIHGDELAAGGDRASLETRLADACTRAGHCPVAAIPGFHW